MPKQRNTEGFDTSVIVWGAYSIFYKSKSDCKKPLCLGNRFDLKNPTIDKNGRKTAKIIDNSNIENEGISLSGDIIFNFSGKDTRNGMGQYDIFKKYIKTIEDEYENEKEEYLNKLEVCHRMHFSIENCSLMIKQGNL